MSLASLTALFEQSHWLPVLRPHWERISELYIGEKLAIGTLLVVSLLGSIAATNRFFAGHFGWPKARKALKAPKRKKGFGIKHVILVLLALLPGGLVGTFTVYAIMGKERWRRDALTIVEISVLPGLLLLSLRAPFLPWPQLRDTVYFSGLLGLIFGLLQIWAAVKLLREWLGEPDECVPWWPPLALCLQLLATVALGMWLLGP
ncbi:MAG TPA: hypothetical protein VGP72_22605 [Planctomycetota bacterium]